MFVNVYDYLIWELIDLTSLNCIMFHKTVITLRQSHQIEIATLIKKGLSTIIGALIRISVLKQNSWLTLYTLPNKFTFAVIERMFLKMMDSNLFWELSFTIKSALLLCWIFQINKYLCAGWCAKIQVFFFSLGDKKITPMQFSYLTG